MGIGIVDARNIWQIRSEEVISKLENIKDIVRKADLNNQDALLAVTDEESDAAVDMFGCDCVASINCLPKLRNRLP